MLAGFLLVYRLLFLILFVHRIDQSNNSTNSRQSVFSHSNAMANIVHCLAETHEFEEEEEKKYP